MTTTVLQGDVLAVLATLPDNHFDCVVTSPPYWGLRDYGVEGQIGMEATMAEHVEVMVRVMAAVHRVLKPTGTVWFNYGDCYASTPNGRSAADVKAIGNDDRTFRDKPFSTIQGNLKPKDLTMMPNRIAIALQDWGWWVRSEIFWGKPNPMPESVHDRPATSHEKIFMLTKSARYFYDAEAVRQPATGNTHSRGSKLSPPNEDMPHGRKGWSKSIENKAAGYRTPTGWDTSSGSHGTIHKNGRTSDRPLKVRGSKVASQRHKNSICHTKLDETPRGEGRNLRNWEPAIPQVWKIATRGFKGAHFATFPPELVERCLSAGCPTGGNVLDPFGGAGTTALVADQMLMDCTLIELSQEYIDITRQRLASGLVKMDKPAEPKPTVGGLFDMMEIGS